MNMIKSFNCKETELIWKGEFSRKLPQSIQRTARAKLRMLNNSKTLIDLRSPPSNHLETRQDYRKGDKSIKINDQWRIVFTWTDGDCHEVEIIDYH
jgi:proteic killer suppression protein